MNDQTLKIIITNMITVPIKENHPLRKNLKEYFTLDNPKWIENFKMGRYNGNTPKKLFHYEEHSNFIYLPRGALNEITTLCQEYYSIELLDRTDFFNEIDFSFHGSLYSYQEPAIDAIIEHPESVLSAATAAGKTIIALYLVCQWKQPTLIIVHTKELLYQWINRIHTFLKIPIDEIGIIGDGQYFKGRKITVALVQSLKKNPLPKTGCLIVDENHRTPSTTFTNIIKRYQGQYILGLSATPYRRDGLTSLVHWYCGPTRYEITSEQLIKQKKICYINPIIRRTLFRSALMNPAEQYPRLLKEITEHKHRNKMIAQDAIKEAKETSNGICLVLSDRKSHLYTLQNIINRIDRSLKTEILHGQIPNRKTIVKLVENNLIDILLATTQLVGEGWDCKNLSSLFLTTPIRFPGRLIQNLGRTLRLAKGKSYATIYDYFDEDVFCLRGGFKERMKVYDQLKLQQ